MLLHRPAYSMVMLVVGMVACMAVAVGVSNANTDRAVHKMIETDQRRRADDAAAAVAARQASCRVIATMADGYAKDPPKVPSETYDNVSKAWAELAEFC